MTAIRSRRNMQKNEPDRNSAKSEEHVSRQRTCPTIIPMNPSCQRDIKQEVDRHFPSIQNRENDSGAFGATDINLLVRLNGYSLLRPYTLRIGMHGIFRELRRLYVQP